MVGYGLCVDVHIIFFGMLGYDVVNIIFLYMVFDIDLFVNICRLIPMFRGGYSTNMLMGVDEVVSFEDFDVPMT